MEVFSHSAMARKELPWNDGHLAIQLSIASEMGQYSDVLALLQRGADPDHLWSLHRACRNSHPDCATALLLWGADPGRRTSGGDRAISLHYACLNNNLASVKLLLDHHSPTDIKDSDGLTPEAIAREKQYYEVADFIEKWVPPPRGPLSIYPSIKKLSYFQIESWMQLGHHLGLTEDEIGPIRNTQYPTTYIFIEVKRKDMKQLQWKDVVQAFLSIGENELADTVCKELGEGHTVLSVCAFYGWLEFIKSAKKYNPSDPVNDSGDTMLAIACAQGNMVLIDYFVKDKGFDLDGSVNKAGQSLRSLAESLQLSEVIKYLDNLNAGIGVQQKYLEILDKMISDKKNTILLRFLKMYFIGSSGIGKTTTRNRLIGVITNLISLPKGERKCRSTYLAECNQVLAVMDDTDAKLTLKASGDFDDETRLLFAYVYRHLFSSTDEDDSSALVISTPSESIDHSVAGKDGGVESTVSDARTKNPTTKVTKAESTAPSLSIEKVATEVDKVIARFRSIVGSGKYTEQLMNKILINLIDVGGQPGFLEMLPFLSRGPGMFLAFFRLDKELEELCEVSYEREDDRIIPYKAIYTIRETLSQILSAIDHHVAVDATSDQQFHSKLGDLSSMRPVATLVGTFKDKLETKVKTKILNEKITQFSQTSESEKEKVHKHALASLEADCGEPTPKTGTDIQRSADELLASESFKKEVQDRLYQELEMRRKNICTIANKFEDLLIPPPGEQNFVALDNFKGTEADIDPLREHLQAMFRNFFEDKKLRIRPTHLLLGVILRTEYNIVSMDDCIQIGRALSMTEEEVGFTVWYMDHWAGALIYRPEIDEWFKKNIICNPQVVFDSISSLIVESLLQFHSPTSECRFFPAEQKNWTDKGQFSLETVKRCHSKENKDKVKQGKLIPEDKLVKFLQHCNLLSFITSKTTKGKCETMCFIPAILECSSLEELQQSPPPDIDTPSPIKITFKTGYVPVGLFCALISRLVSRGSEGILGMTWKLVESRVKRNLVSFRVTSVEHIITLVVHADCYEIRVIRQNRFIKLNDLCSYVLSTLFYMIKEINSNILPIIAFDCKCSGHQSSTHNHLCVLTPGMPTCFMCNGCQVSLTNEQKCWFTKEVIIGEETSFRALLYTDPDSSFFFKWIKPDNRSLSCRENELTVEKVTKAMCRGFYTCEISKDKKPFFSVYFCLRETSAVEIVISDEDQLLDDVRQLTKNVRSHWYSLAIELGIDYGTRNAIERDYRFVDVCFHAMLRDWVKRTPSKSALVKALQSPAINRKDIASKVEKILNKVGVASLSDDSSCILSTLDQHAPLNVDKHLKAVREIVWDVRAKWRDLGQELGIDVETLTTIESDYLNKSDLCLTHLLEKWLTKTPPPTVSALVEALKSPPVGREDIVHGKLK